MAITTAVATHDTFEITHYANCTWVLRHCWRLSRYCLCYCMSFS